MLYLETNTSESSSRFLHDAKPAWCEVYLGGSPQELASLRTAIVTIQNDAKPSAHPVQCPDGVHEVYLLRALTGLHVIPLQHGLAICADQSGFEELADGLRICLENESSPSPIKGFHRQIELIDEHGAKHAPIGTLTIHVAEQS